VGDAEGDSSSDEDYSDDEEEGEDGYRPGGYHPVSIGDKFSNRYVVIEKLGWGHFSTVWRCYDLKTSTPDKAEYVALKIQKSASHYREAAIDEIELLNCIKTAMVSKPALLEYPPDFDHHIVNLVDSFDHLGRNGNHVCMAFEILGENLLKVIKKYSYRGMPLSIVRDFARQICTGMDFLHRHCQIIHTDLKPENILIATRAGEPDLNFVRSLIGEKVAGAGKSSKSKKGKPAAGAGATPAEKAAADGGAEGDLLSPEQKKKLKKKLKKKRQLARKKEDTKKQRSRRKGRGKRQAESSVEKANLEMMMMERASIPHSTYAGEANGAADTEGRDHIADAGEDEAGTLVAPMHNLSLIAPSKAPAKNGVQSKGDLDSKGPGTYKATGSAKGLDDEDDPTPPRAGAKHSSHDSDLQVHNLEYDAADCKGTGTNGEAHLRPRDTVRATVRAEHERIYHSLPAWARPTVFTYLNFDLLGGVDTADCVDKPLTPVHSSSNDQGDLLYGRAVQVLPEDFRPPSKLMQAKFTMVSGLCRIILHSLQA
jgi:hypothetical protein